VDGKAPETLLSQWEAMMPKRVAEVVTLFLAMIVTWNEPDRSKRLKCHTLAIVLNRDRGFAAVPEVEADYHLVRVGVVSVFHQLENGKPRTPDQLVPEELKEARSWSEGELQFVSRVRTHLISWFGGKNALISAPVPGSNPSTGAYFLCVVYGMSLSCDGGASPAVIRRLPVSSAKRSYRARHPNGFVRVTGWLGNDVSWVSDPGPMEPTLVRFSKTGADRGVGLRKKR
jgi:hypothetical protein